MIITRTVAPTVAALSPGEIAEWLRIDSDTDAATLAMLLDSAVEYVEGQINRVLLPSTFEVTVAQPCGTIVLPMAPIRSVSIATLAADAWTYDGAQTVELVGDQLETITLIVEAGYPSPDAVPASLRHAMAVLVGASYDSRNALDPASLVTVERLVAAHRRFLA